MNSSRDHAQSTTDGHGAPTPHADKGPMRILCDEIGFPFDRRLEREDLFVAFVRELFAEIDSQRWLLDRVSKVGGKPPSEASGEVLGLARRMFDANLSRTYRRAMAVQVHDACRLHNPDDAYPTDHLIDMISSCASAIRFGLEAPCRSRHAAEAARHVWGQAYGISRFDNETPEWLHSWSRMRLISALVSLLPSDDGAERVHTGQLRDEQP